MIKTTAVRLLFIVALFGAWLLAHYIFDKKSAEGLGIYVILILGPLAFMLDRWYIGRRSKKKEQEV